MQTIDAMRVRIEKTQVLGDTLAAAWDAFELIRATADRRADRADGLFAAFMMATAEAANGRDTVGLAPSLPMGRAAGTEPWDADSGDLDHVATALAELAAMLSVRLAAAAAEAADEADRAACGDAARAAEHVQTLLARDG